MIRAHSRSLVGMAELMTVTKNEIVRGLLGRVEPGGSHTTDATARATASTLPSFRAATQILPASVP